MIPFIAGRGNTGTVSYQVRPPPANAATKSGLALFVCEESSMHQFNTTICFIIPDLQIHPVLPMKEAKLWQRILVWFEGKSKSASTGGTRLAFVKMLTELRFVGREPIADCLPSGQGFQTTVATFPHVQEFPPVRQV